MLDDLDFMMADNVRAAGTPFIKHRSVHTDDRICLTEDGAREAVRILVQPNPQEDRGLAPKRRAVEAPEEGRGNCLAGTTVDVLTP